MAKGKRLTFRYDDKLDKVLTDICDRDGCNKSELVEALLRDSLEDELNGKTAANPADRPTPVGRLVRKEDDDQYIPHKSNPNIKLVRQIYDTNTGRTTYRDTEGKEWLMQKDRTLVAIAKVVV